MEKGLVSIVIPCYNSGEYISDTLESIRQQTYQCWEIIIIDDGSTDNSIKVVKEKGLPRIQIYHQSNLGVSEARNSGIRLSRGEYIMFLDADDILSPDFLKVRILALEANQSLAFAAGIIELFPGPSIKKKGAGANVEQEILFFSEGYATVPSNYLFRKSIISDNDFKFHINLSSTADRFFILQIAKRFRGIVVLKEDGKLLYRVTANSMSHKVTPKLMKDNYQFLKEIKRAGLLPLQNRQTFLSKYYFSIGLGYLKINKIIPSLRFLLNSLAAHPGCFYSQVFRKFRDAGKIQ